jgi:hypothetical protein
MKKIIYSLFVCLLLVLVSCQDKTSYDVSKITYYVTYKMSGNQTTLVPVGTAYVDPGIKAMEGAKDVTSTMKTTGTVNPAMIGLYPVTYSAINADGFASSATRLVIVYDPTVTADISGQYQLATGSYRKVISSGAKTSFSGYNISLTKIAPGIFYVSDFLGGYYDQRAAYGSTYAMTGYVKLNPDNTLGLLSSKIAGWGDSLNSLANATFNSGTKVIHWDATYAGTYTWFLDFNKQ